MRRIDDALAGTRVAQQIGRFSQLPRRDDMAGFALPREDIKALRECRPGRCDVKLPADVMGRLQAAVDWSARDAEQQASQAMAGWLTDYLDGYHDDGHRRILIEDITDALAGRGHEMPPLLGRERLADPVKEWPRRQLPVYLKPGLHRI